MTQLANFSGALHLLLSFTALWFLVFRLVGEYRLDSLRDRLFAIRERLFDYAADGNITFDHPAYTKLRMRINSLIRFGYRLTFTRFAMGVIFITWKNAPYDREILFEWENAVKELPPEVQVELNRISDETLVLVVRHLVSGSPVMMAILVVFSIGELLSGITTRLLEAFTKKLPGLDVLQIEVMVADAEERHPERAMAHQ
jgi:hypothetical protein